MGGRLHAVSRLASRSAEATVGALTSLIHATETTMATVDRECSDSCDGAVQCTISQ
ncbi:hypothetical protein BVI434_1040017 [Burkholderia vietnamiensis]|nr:hypothetical protein BVI434_1040017 [Burkholderia vietnamiensis]